VYNHRKVHMRANSNAAVLVLDVDFKPLRIEHWKTIIGDFFTGKVEIIHNSQDRTIKTVSRDFPMPSVVRVLRRFRRDKQAIKFSRLNVYARDAFTCQYCTERKMAEELTFDHVVPRAQGGRTCWENIVAACVSCNFEKANRTPAQAGMTLMRRPKKPHALPTITVEMTGKDVPDEWKFYWSASLER
jgi:5-methylcytosine-specific restriction endonuclease McrA